MSESKFEKSAARNDQENDTAVNAQNEQARFNGYCWVYVGDRKLTEVGICPSCFRYWGASTKWLTCVCGSNVSLT